jgi:hypothetical protein
MPSGASSRGEVLGQRVAAGLGRRVGARRRGGDRVDGPHRADVDDRAAAALAHRADGGLADPERRAQDRAERLLEVLLGLLGEGDGAEDPRAVDEHVDAAEALDGSGDERPGVVAAGDAAGVQRRALAARVDLLLRGAQDRLARPAEDDARALGQEACRRRLADAAATAGDEDDAALELPAHDDLRLA